MSGIKRFWFPYTPCGSKGEFFSSIVKARLRSTTGMVRKLSFICDTGSSLTWADDISFGMLFPEEVDQFEAMLQPSGLKDENGQPLLGIKRQVVISISSNPNFKATEYSPTEEITFSEEVYFGKVAFNLLGQTAFEKIGGLFHNFPTDKKGRRFALFENHLIT